MSFSVKNTTRHKLFEVVCPHYCMFCGKIGRILCECCKNSNIDDRATSCLNCGVAVKNGHCERCDLPFVRGYAVGEKDCAVMQAVELYKYKSTRALYVPLAEMMNVALPYLPDDTVVVPAPTNQKHVRVRGLDHAWLIAKELARIRGWKCEKLIVRAKDSVQVGADRKTRIRQAKEAYALNGRWSVGDAREARPKKHSIDVPVDAHFLVIDDVWTTGSSMKAMCELLKNAGAENITAAVLVRA